MEKELEIIIQKVKDLYLKYGIRSVSMDDVAKELGISKKTLYQYVLHKDALVQRVIECEMKRNFNLFLPVFDKGYNAIEELLELNKIIRVIKDQYVPSMEYDLRKYHPSVYEYLHNARLKNMYCMVHKNLEHGQEQGLYRKEMNIDIIAKLHISRVQNILDYKGLFSIDDILSNEIFAEIMEYHLRGICNEKGIQILEQRLEEFKNKANE